MEILIRNGRVIDPRNEINDVRDVGIANGKIVRVDHNIPPQDAQLVIDATGMMITPGLVDLHGHYYYGTQPDSDYSNGFKAVPPDGFTLRSGVTTAVDAGGSGWRNFADFQKQVIERSQTRVLAMLNIVGSGMKGDPMEQNLEDMDADLTARCAKEFPEVIVGIKVAHYRGPDWIPVERAVQAGRLASLPVMVDFGRHVPPLSLRRLLLEYLRPGDIYTHMYAHIPERLPIVDEKGALEPYVRQARERGIIFDVGHGAGSFVFAQAIPALAQGFAPDSISTDLHAESMNAGLKDMSNLLSKFLSLGVDLSDVIRMSTWNPARILHRTDLGHLSPGARADLAVWTLRHGEFGFVDVEGWKVPGTLKLDCEVTMRDGEVVWDLNGLSKPLGQTGTKDNLKRAP